MEPTWHSTNGMHKLLWVCFWWVVCIMCVVIFSHFAVIAEENLSPEVFKESSFTWAAAVILSFPMYVMFSLLPKVLSGLRVNFSFLWTKLHGLIFALYLVFSSVAYRQIRDEKEKWHLFVPFVLAAVLESLWCTAKGYAPIEINRYYQESPSIGEVWANACSSYYLEVFKDFRERLEKFEKEQRQLDEMFTIRLKKMIVLIPLSCDAEGTLDKHPNIEYYNILDIHKDARGGNVNRQYKNPVYKITSKDGNNLHHLYVAIEEPNTLVALKKLKKEVPEEIWKYQRSEFISTLCYALSDKCCKTLIYNDLQEEGPVQPLSEFLIGEIRKLLLAEGNEC